MYAKEFVEKNYGKKWLINSAMAPTGPIPTYTAIIIGYIDKWPSDYVIIEPDNVRCAYGPIHGYDITILHPYKINEHTGTADIVKRYYCIMANLVEQVIEAPSIIISPYPHTCKSCKKPARIAGLFSLCSNYKCKSRQAIKKAYKHSKVEKIKVDSTARFSTGVPYYLDAWKNNDCLLCGERGRDGQPWAHNKCWTGASCEAREETLSITRRPP